MLTMLPDVVRKEFEEDIPLTMRNGFKCLCLQAAQAELAEIQLTIWHFLHANKAYKVGIQLSNCIVCVCVCV